MNDAFYAQSVFSQEGDGSAGGIAAKEYVADSL